MSEEGQADVLRRDLIQALLYSSDPAVRAGAISYLVIAGFTEEVAETLRTVARSDPSPSIRELARGVLDLPSWFLDRVRTS